jgi:hypothetical protein
MDSLAEQMEKFTREMTTFATRSSREEESEVRAPEEVEFHEEGIEDEMRRNLHETQATYEKLLNGFMEASQSRFLKLEESIGRLEGHVGRIAEKVLSGEVMGSSDSLNLGSARAILRSGRVVNNGRNEGVTSDNNNSPYRG